MNGILFKPDMVKAIVEGRKTQTQRIITKPEVINQQPNKWVQAKPYRTWWFINDGISETWDMTPRYHVGEVVYIKEAGAWDTEHKHNIVFYKANAPEIKAKWQSPMFMPAWAARYFVKITAVKAERLQEITEEDCIAEGIERHEDSGHNIFWYEVAGDYHGGTQSVTLIEAYRKLWNSINAKWKRIYNRELKIYEFWQFPWSEEDAKPVPKNTKHPERYHCIPNPWVWVYSFEAGIAPWREK